MATKSNVSVSFGDLFKTREGVLVNTGSREPDYWTRLPGIFNKKFGISQFIREEGRKDLYYQRNVEDRQTGRRRDVITLIVKEHEGTYVDEQHLTELLYTLRDFCEKNNIHQLVMPKICCGVHGCEWVRINNILRGIFNGTSIKVTVKYLDN